jgi:hypothetical protein
MSTRWRYLVLLPVWLFTSGWAAAQWQWVDGTGRKVFSDTPPPASVPEQQILKRPGPRHSAPVPAPTVSPDAAVTASPAAPRLPVRDEQLEARKKQAEEAEQAKKKAEEERLAKARADSCDRAKRAKATLNSGLRIATTNAKGEREIMDEKALAQENQRIDEIVRSECATPAK